MEVSTAGETWKRGLKTLSGNTGATTEGNQGRKVSGSANVGNVISGATLRQLRLRTGRSQRNVAAAIGIPATVLSAYERGRRQPGVETAGRIIQALGFTVRFVPALDPLVQSRRLEDVLRLAEALPYRPRPLAKARR